MTCSKTDDSYGLGGAGGSEHVCGDLCLGRRMQVYVLEVDASLSFSETDFSNLGAPSLVCGLTS